MVKRGMSTGATTCRWASWWRESHWPFCWRAWSMPSTAARTAPSPMVCTCNWNLSRSKAAKYSLICAWVNINSALPPVSFRGSRNTAVPLSSTPSRKNLAECMLTRSPW
ncbi:hypothetical protein D3C79_803630 [compost metagenome]